MNSAFSKQSCCSESGLTRLLIVTIVYEILVVVRLNFALSVFESVCMCVYGSECVFILI